MGERKSQLVWGAYFCVTLISDVQSVAIATLRNASYSAEIGSARRP